jgi:predicted nucleic acid-binding protein
MNVLVDTNIVLDVLLDQAPFADPAAALWAKAQSGELKASLVATTMTTIYYITRKSLGAEAALRAVADLLRVFEALSVDHAILATALASPLRDFEDAVQDAAADRAGIPIIVTRDPRGFAGSSRRIVDAGTLVAELDAS